LFGAVLLACFLLCVIAPFVGWWLPRSVGTFGGDHVPPVGYDIAYSGVDGLWNMILVLNRLLFSALLVILVYTMYRYAGREGARSVYTHGNHRLEMVWTAVPAAIPPVHCLCPIPVWNRIKLPSQMPSSRVRLPTLPGRKPANQTMSSR